MTHKLGEWAELSHEDRLKKYEDYPTVETGDEGEMLERVQWLKGQFPITGSTTFLDIGCNNGFVTRWMVEAGIGLVVGIDPGKQAIEQAFAKVDGRSNVVYLQMGWEELKTPMKFDGMCLFEAIEHFPHQDVYDLLAFMHEHLAGWGTAYICTPNIDGRWGRTNPDPAHINLYSKDDLVKQIEEVIGRKPEVCNYTDNCDFLYVKWTK